VGLLLLLFPTILVIEANPNQWFCGVGFLVGANSYISNLRSSVGTDNFILNIQNNTAGSLDIKYKCYIMGDSGN
jgi:hypothetical protein